MVQYEKSLIALFSRVILNYATSHNEPKRAIASHNNHKKSLRATGSHRNLQQPPRNSRSITFCTLCFIYNKIKSCFYGLLFLIINALLFSFAKLKLPTYHNSYLPSDLAKIKASSKNNTLLRLLSKK